MKRHLTCIFLLLWLCLICVSCTEREMGAHETATAAGSVSASVTETMAEAVTEPTAESVTETTAVTHETEPLQDDISLTSPDGRYWIDLLWAEPDALPLPDGGTAYSICVTDTKTQITFDAINAQDLYMQPENFTWSPDGTYLAFEDNRDPENNRICVIAPEMPSYRVLPSCKELMEICGGVDLGNGKVHLSTLRQSVLSWDENVVCVAMQTRIGDTLTAIGFYRYYLPGGFMAQVTMTYLPPPSPTEDPLQAMIDASLITVTREYMEAPMNLDPAQVFAEPSGAANQILCLGTAAVPYLEEIADTAFEGTGYIDAFETRRQLARYLSCMLDPDAYRAEYLSPDGRYSVVCQPDMQELPTSLYTDNTFISYTVTLLDRESGAALPLQYSCFRPIARWSPDSRYAAMSHGDGVYAVELLLLGTEPLCEIPLPSEEDYKVLLADIIPAGLDNFFFSHMAVEEWLSDDRVKLRVGSGRYGLLSTDNSVTYDVGGYYVYDMKNKTVTETDIDISERAEETAPESQQTAETEPQTVDKTQAVFDEASRQTVDAALSKMVENNAEYENRPVADFLAAFPDEISAIAALGGPAARYLKSVADDAAKDSIYRVFARYLSCMIDPELFLQEYPSPDGAYSIVCQMDPTYLSTHDYFEDGNAHMTVSLVRNTTGEVYTENESIMYKTLRVEWSPDSRYVYVFADAGSYHQTAGNLYDTQSLMHIPLPTDTDIAAMLGAQMPSEVAVFGVSNTVLKEWLSYDCVKLEVHSEELWDADFKKQFWLEGTYVYDMKEKKITEIDCTVRAITPQS